MSKGLLKFVEITSVRDFQVGGGRKGEGERMGREEGQSDGKGTSLTQLSTNTQMSLPL